MKHFLKFSIASFLVIVGTSCSKNAPEPHPEGEHEATAKMEVIFTEGHTHHGNKFYGDEEIKELKYLKKIQKITFILQENKLNMEGAPVRLKKGKHYGVEIIHYNVEGKRINSEFISDTEARIHQHFFMMEEAKTTDGRPTPTMNQVLEYTYRDTNPEDKYINEKGVKLLKRTWDAKNPTENDPIGLKGFFYVKENYMTFMLRITLAHFTGIGKTKLKEDGSLYAFNELPSGSRFYEADVNVRIPVRIYTEEQSPDSVFKADAAKEFGVTEDEIQKDLDHIARHKHEEGHSHRGIHL
ncbi:hypothetical protein [Capnocytophaga canis]|uniref:hypothetical protein n=1 Tax=Capnocytophaga canis TaxID=1848903 RepID=UPI0037D10924